MNYKGFNEQCCTFISDGNVKKGSLVAMSASATVRCARPGERFIGVCLGTRDGYAAVQVGGYAQVFSYNKIPVGYRKLVADGEDGAYLSEAANGLECRVITTADVEGGCVIGFLL